MNFTVAVLPGDGIGPEVVAEGTKALEAIAACFGHRFTFRHGLIGGISIDQHRSALTDDTLEMCREAQAVLLGAVGGPKWDSPRAKTRPEDGLLRIRQELKLFANLRPVKVYPQLIDTTPLKPETLRNVDMVVVRELTGGLYFGRPKDRRDTARGRRAVDTMAYSESEIERILRVGFSLASRRRKKLTSVDKANVLETSRLWREIATELAPEYPQVEVRHMLVDTCAMQMVRSPSQFDVIVTENTFGDILTDEAAVLAGSMGMLPSASLGEKGLSKRTVAGNGTFGLYEPIHGSAPDIAGRDKANPIATILSVAMLLRLSLGLSKEADTIEKAVDSVLDSPYRTPDIAHSGAKVVGTHKMGELVRERIKALAKR